jgi:hypothetical protein
VDAPPPITPIVPANAEALRNDLLLNLFFFFIYLLFFKSIKILSL